MSYNRYQSLSNNGRVEIPPFTRYRQQPTDRSYVWDTYSSRMDLVSFRFYGDPSLDWLIFLANPLISPIEAEIEPGTLLLIPYPLSQALNQYGSSLNTYKTYYTLL